MKWSEILDLAREVYLDDAAIQISGAPDQQWTDATLMKFAKEGQEELARKVWPIFDGGAGFGPAAAPVAGPDGINTGNANDQNGAPLCVIPFVDQQQIYMLNDLILWVERIRISDTDLYLRRVGEADTRPGGPYLQLPVTPAFVSPYIENAGRPTWWDTQGAPKQLRLRPKPDIHQFDGTINPILEGPTPAVLYLDVYRLPMFPVDEQHLQNSPEVDAEFHASIAEFIAAAALVRTTNADAESKKVGAALMKDWDELMNEAKRDVLRRKSAMMTWRFGGWANSSESTW